MKKYWKIDFFCVGTPNINGDAIGPMIGTMLKQHIDDAVQDIRIVGTLDDPVVKTNYFDKLFTLRRDAITIVVDASFGGDVLTYEILQEPMCPGSGMNIEVTPIGDMCVKCYTGRSVQEMILQPYSAIIDLALMVTTELLDLLKTTKIKDIYRVLS